MHELNICLSLIRIIEQEVLADTARQGSLCRVKKIWLEVGDLAGIDTDALRFSFPIAAARSIANNASLMIITLAGRAWCNECHDSVTIKTRLDSCPNCGNYDYRIMQGKELRVVKMEVE